jgi:uncharacterized protein (UPF0248 family)
MMPIEELLNRIRWDKEFGKGDFKIGYEDHIEQKVIRVRFQNIRFKEGNHISFQVENAEGKVQTIPFHGVREVYKDGSLIWHRHPRLKEKTTLK